jgi:ferric-dicitrate binding protein FerR (iron transport regulator)
MEVTEELIHKFLRQECKPEERSAVNEYFNQHPAELDKYLGDEEWENFNDYPKLHPAISQQMLDVIEQNIDVPAPKKFPYLKIMAIAASTVVVLGVGILIAFNINKGNLSTTIAANHQQVNLLTYDTVFNKAAKAMEVKLQDGSAILLSGKSEIVYQRPFTQKKRDIYLKGEAFFKVAKDKSRPFTVYAGGLSTTALGTSFRVTAFTADKKVMVRLFTGKVVIKQKLNDYATDNNNVYLTPGRMLELDKESQITKVSNFLGDESALSKVQVEKGTTTIIDNIIQFHNQSLTEVINVLQKAYQIKIQADQNKLSNKYFTGNIDTRTDLPYDVLHTITTINKLTLKKQDNVYMIDQ